jgi:hypothetical protein
MSDRERLARVQSDLRRGVRGVLYCEGKTDPAVLFALLGRARPAGDLLGDCYVVGLKEGSSGGAEVEALVRVARANGLSTVWGVCDGDGRALSALRAEFDAPFPGPVFRWRGYCIENLLAQAAWPSAWGAAPDWEVALLGYAPYAALNRVHVELRAALETLGLHKFRNPQAGKALETQASMLAALAADKHRVAGYDVARRFEGECQLVCDAIRASVEEGHATINGKWLLRHFCNTTNQPEEGRRAAWCEAARAAGGLPAVKAWWERLMGASP